MWERGGKAPGTAVLTENASPAECQNTAGWHP